MKINIIFQTKNQKVKHSKKDERGWQSKIKLDKIKKDISKDQEELKEN